MVIWMFQLDFQSTRFLPGHTRVLQGAMLMCYNILLRDQRQRGHVQNILGSSRAWVLDPPADAHHLCVSVLI
jgi:hypothetical protein